MNVTYSYGYENLDNILISEEELKNKISKLGEDISNEYNGKKLLIVAILKGSFVFLADLCREIKTPCEVDFMRTASYGDSTVSSGEVKILFGLERDISDYHIILVEDIIDTGRTLKCVAKQIQDRKPLSFKVITLLDKPDRREVNFEADISLFTIPDLFVVGYGLDFNEKYRNLPYIAQLN